MENINAGPDDGDEGLPQVRTYLQRGNGSDDEYDDDGSNNNDGFVHR